MCRFIGAIREKNGVGARDGGGEERMNEMKTCITIELASSKGFRTTGQGGRAC